jgi:glycerol-3-phosphate dehydrogenase (NAD(P)+)
MKIAYLGAGTWGFCLARLLAEKGHKVTSWTIDSALLQTLNSTREHPHLPGRKADPSMLFTGNLLETLDGAEMIVEAVTSAGIRPVFEQVKKSGLTKPIPICITSKGIEQNTGLILPDVITEVLGSTYQSFVSVLSGPSFAEEVSQNLPTSIVCGSTSADTAKLVSETFSTPFLRVYPNRDIRGVAFGGSLKNIIAIACGISDGLKLGTGARAALMTRGLHEMVKLAKREGCNPETLYGLSGMGDLFLTASSSTSRNYRFGMLLAEGKNIQDAKKSIQMVVEGAYTALSAVQLAKTTDTAMPIAEMVLAIIEGKINPKDAALLLMQRSIKEESL